MCVWHAAHRRADNSSGCSHWFHSAAATHVDASARECTSDAGGLSYPGEDTGGSGPGQTGNQGDGLRPVSHCQGSHLDRGTHGQAHRERGHSEVCLHWLVPSWCSECVVAVTHVSSHGDASQSQWPVAFSLQPTKQHCWLQDQGPSHHKQVRDVLQTWSPKNADILFRVYEINPPAQTLLSCISSSWLKTCISDHFCQY